MSAYDELAALCGLKNPIGHDLIVAAGAKIESLQATLQRIADDDPSGKWGRWAREALTQDKCAP